MQDLRPENGPAQIATALCTASRWLSAASLLFTVCTFAALLAGARMTAALALVLVLGALNMYLALRIEFDRAIFAAVATGQGWPPFDAALRELGLRRKPDAGRTSIARAGGVLRLVRYSGAAFAAQIVFALWALVLR